MAKWNFYLVTNVVFIWLTVFVYSLITMDFVV
jgi:hypothetical protein